MGPPPAAPSRAPRRLSRRPRRPSIPRRAKGVRVAWLACTFSTNGIPDAKNQVLSCYDDKATVLQTIADLKKITAITV